MTLYKGGNKRREIIMKHYQFPKMANEEINHFDKEKNSKYCIDNFKLKINWEKNIVKEAFFIGEGCAVFISSIDIFLEIIINKKISEIKNILDNYKNMIFNCGTYDELVLGKLLVFENVGKRFNRIHCAEMIEITLREIINEKIKALS